MEFVAGMAVGFILGVAALVVLAVTYKNGE